MCQMRDSQRNHCQQIISSTVCCTCIPVTKWCHWYTQKSCLSACACPIQHGVSGLEEHRDRTFNSQFWPGCTWSSLRGWCGVTPSLLICSCHFPVALASREASWSLLWQRVVVVPSLAVPVPQQPGTGSIPVPSLLTRLLLIASLIY